MSNEVTISREFIESVIDELQEAIDTLCPCPNTFPVTKGVCKACRLNNVCEKIMKAAVTLSFTK